MLWCAPSYCQIIKVTLLGTGTPILNINRFGISTLVEAGDQKLLFDAGRGAAIRLHQVSVPLRDVSAIFLSLLTSQACRTFMQWRGFRLKMDDDKSRLKFGDRKASIT